MTSPFEWQGKPSVWADDKKIKQSIAARKNGIKSRERYKLTETYIEYPAVPKKRRRK